MLPQSAFLRVRFKVVLAQVDLSWGDADLFEVVLAVLLTVAEVTAAVIAVVVVAVVLVAMVAADVDLGVVVETGVETTVALLTYMWMDIKSRM